MKANREKGFSLLHTPYSAHADTIISDVCTGRYTYRYRQVLIQVQAGTHTGTGRYMYMCLLIISQTAGHSPVALSLY